MKDKPHSAGAKLDYTAGAYPDLRIRNSTRGIGPTSGYRHQHFVRWPKQFAVAH